MYVLIFCTAFVWSTNYSERDSAKYFHKCSQFVIWSRRYFCQILMKLDFSRHFRKILVSNSMKIRSGWAEFHAKVQPYSHTDRQPYRTDRETDSHTEQRDRQPYIHTYIHKDWQTDRQPGSHTEQTAIKTDRKRQTASRTDRPTAIQTDRHDEADSLFSLSQPCQAPFPSLHRRAVPFRTGTDRARSVRYDDRFSWNVIPLLPDFTNIRAVSVCSVDDIAQGERTQRCGSQRSAEEHAQYYLHCV